MKNAHVSHDICRLHDRLVLFPFRPSFRLRQRDLKSLNSAVLGGPRYVVIVDESLYM